MRSSEARGPAGALVAVMMVIAGCSSSSASPEGAGDMCNPDENGTAGGTTVVKLTVSDTAFNVGTADSGPGEPNIAAENSANIVLMLTNVGAKPHDFVVGCLPTPNTLGCPTQSCFPTGANVATLQPGAGATVMFVTPVHEGAYTFTSDLPGDEALVGRFVLM